MADTQVLFEASRALELLAGKDDSGLGLKVGDSVGRALPGRPIPPKVWLLKMTQWLAGKKERFMRLTFRSASTSPSV